MFLDAGRLQRASTMWRGSRVRLYGAPRLLSREKPGPPRSLIALLTVERSSTWQRVAAAAGGDVGDRAVLGQQLGVAGAGAAHRLDDRLVGAEHRDQPGQAALDLLDVDDVGLVDAACGRPLRGVVDLDRDHRAASATAPTPVSGLTAAGVGLGVGAWSSASARCGVADVAAASSAAGADGLACGRPPPQAAATRRATATALDGRESGWRGRHRILARQSRDARGRGTASRCGNSRVVDVEELRAARAGRPDAAAAASGAPAAYGCRAPHRCRSGGRSAPGRPPRSARRPRPARQRRRARPSSVTARPTAFSAACRSSAGRGQRRARGRARWYAGARRRERRCRPISATCSSAAARRTSWASSAAWAASTRACSRSSRVSVKVTHIVSRTASEDGERPASRREHGARTLAARPGSRMRPAQAGRPSPAIASS